MEPGQQGTDNRLGFAEKVVFDSLKLDNHLVERVYSIIVRLTVTTRGTPRARHRDHLSTAVNGRRHQQLARHLGGFPDCHET